MEINEILKNNQYTTTNTKKRMAYNCLVFLYGIIAASFRYIKIFYKSLTRKLEKRWNIVEREREKRLEQTTTNFTRIFKYIIIEDIGLCNGINIEIPISINDNTTHT